MRYVTARADELTLVAGAVAEVAPGEPLGDSEGREAAMVVTDAVGAFGAVYAA